MPWATCTRRTGGFTIPSELAACQDFYESFATAVEADGDIPVRVDDAIRTLEVLDAARTSALETRVLAISPGWGSPA